MAPTIFQTGVLCGVKLCNIYLLYYILQYYSYFVGLKQNKRNTSVFSSRANLLANMLVSHPSPNICNKHTATQNCATS